MPVLSMAAMAWVAGTIIAAYLGCLLYAVTAKPKQHDPQRGMAVGCLMIAAIPGVLIALLLIIGVIGGYTGLVRVLYQVTAVPAAFVLVLLIAQPLIKRR